MATVRQSADPITVSRQLADRRYLECASDVNRTLSELLFLREICPRIGATDTDCLGQAAIRQREALLAQILDIQQ